MTPSNPQDPQKGKVDEAKVEEEAKEAKETPVEAEAQPEPKAKPKAKAKAKAKGKAKAKAKPAKPAAAEETGVDKDAVTAAEAEAEDEAAAKPEAEAEDEAAAKPKAKAKAKAEPKAKAKAKAAKKAAPKRRRREAAEPGVLVHAQAKYVRTSARKARLVCDHIRGKDVAEARAILAFTPRAAAKAWIKLLESAVANAEHNHELVGEDLRIAAVHADEGPTLKRYRPRAMGRATRIRKRTSHLTITLTPKES
jgi:ribosomal protein L22